jgi:hypothetical protein
MVGKREADRHCRDAKRRCEPAGDAGPSVTGVVAASAASLVSADPPGDRPPCRGAGGAGGAARSGCRGRHNDPQCLVLDVRNRTDRPTPLRYGGRLSRLGV